MVIKSFLFIFLSLAICFSADISGCTKISSSGTYFLAGDINGAIPTTDVTKNACIHITASDVILDCRGASITNNGTANSIGIWLDQASRTTIKNCAMSGYLDGLLAKSSAEIKINHVTANNNNFGFYFSDIRSATISSNTATKNNGYGYYFDSSSRNSITYNSAQENNIGFGFAHGSNYNEPVSNNKANNNKLSGYEFSASSSNIFKNNVASENQNGIYFNQTSENLLSGNSFYKNQFGNYIYGSRITISGDKYSSSSESDLRIYASSALPSSISASNIVFDDGESTTSSIISIVDTTTSSYSVKWVQAPEAPTGYTVFPHDSIELSSGDSSGDPFSIDTLTMSWSTFNDATYSEEDFYPGINDGEWSLLLGTLSTSDHQMIIKNAKYEGVYSIIQKLPPPKALLVYYLLGCNKTTITIKNNSGSLVAGANVKFETASNSYLLTTNSSGEVVFPICGKPFTASASKEGYVGNSLSPLQVTCVCDRCQSDNECFDYQKCTNQKCIGIPCLNGTIYNHQCVACTKNSDCSDGQNCKQNQCVSSEFECVVDVDCNLSDAPNNNQNRTQNPSLDKNQLKICKDHKCLPKPECNVDSECNSNQVCQSEICKEIVYEIIAPKLILLGDIATISFRNYGLSCINCELEIRSPSNAITTATTDAKGSYQLAAKENGTYVVSLIKNTSSVKTVSIEVTSSQKSDPAANSLFNSLFNYVALFILSSVILVAIILGYFYYQSKNKPK